MKHITYAEKSLLVGDEVADLVLRYGAVLASNGQADTVTLHAVGADGDEVDATLLLDAGSNLMAETSNTSLAEPDNADAVMYIRQKIMYLTSPRTALPTDETMPATYDELGLE